MQPHITEYRVGCDIEYLHHQSDPCQHKSPSSLLVFNIIFQVVLINYKLSKIIYKKFISFSLFYRPKFQFQFCFWNKIAYIWSWEEKTKVISIFLNVNSLVLRVKSTSKLHLTNDLLHIVQIDANPFLIKVILTNKESIPIMVCLSLIMQKMQKKKTPIFKAISFIRWHCLCHWFDHMQAKSCEYQPLFIALR